MNDLKIICKNCEHCIDQHNDYGLGTCAITREVVDLDATCQFNRVEDVESN